MALVLELNKYIEANTSKTIGDMKALLTRLVATVDMVYNILAPGINVVFGKYSVLSRLATKTVDLRQSLQENMTEYYGYLVNFSTEEKTLFVVNWSKPLQISE